MKFRVVITRSAEADADAIYDWLKERSPRGAVNWWKAFLHTVDSLREHADSFGRAAEAEDHHELLLERSFKTRYGNASRVVFTIRDELVYVLRVRRAGQSLLAFNEIEFPE